MVDPIFELIALYIEREATAWLTAPEAVHPLRAAIRAGVFGTEDQRLKAVQDDGLDVADSLMKLAEQVRAGDVEKARNHLRMTARNSTEAFGLLKALDPRAKPWYPDGDANGYPVVVGNKYRWTPDTDNQRREAGYYCEGTVTRVTAGMAFATWLRIGEANPDYWGRYGQLSDLPDPLRETWVFTKMLSPVVDEPEGDDQ